MLALAEVRIFNWNIRIYRIYLLLAYICGHPSLFNSSAFGSHPVTRARRTWKSFLPNPCNLNVKKKYINTLWISITIKTQGYYSLTKILLHYRLRHHLHLCTTKFGLLIASYHIFVINVLMLNTSMKLSIKLQLHSTLLVQISFIVLRRAMQSSFKKSVFPQAP